MGLVWIGIIVIVLILVAIKYGSVQYRKRKLAQIRKEYGAIPKREFVAKNLRYLMDSEDLDYDIDDITWNDLNMDAVYARINQCNSFIGEQILYRELHRVSQDKQKMQDRETFIEDMITDVKRRESIQMRLVKIGKGLYCYYLPMFVKEIDDFQIERIWIYRILSGTFIGTLLLGLLWNPNILVITGVVFIINIVLYTLKKQEFELHFSMLNSVLDVIRVANIFITKEQVTQGGLAEDSIEAVKRMNKVAKKLGNFQSKVEIARTGDPSGIFFEYLIGSTLWDIHVFDKIIKMISEDRAAFMQLYAYIGEIDMGISIASYRASVPYYCLPTFQRKNEIEMDDVYHPLINNPISNDVKMETHFIITGSNASGKSTYIKAIAINMILAQSIHTVLSRKTMIPYANVLTSMAVRDDVISGESYYMREINYLKRIVQQLQEEKLTLCIVDEILRGTNTKERIAASVAILEYMCERNSLVIVATHDIEVSRMLEGKYDNCHFTEVLERDDIIFDYKVKQGVSTSTNAIKLLEYVGFPDSIVRHAQEIVGGNEKVFE